jgi:hypothetical protein
LVIVGIAVQRSLLIAGLTSLACAATVAQAGDDPVDFFMEPETGTMVTIPGLDGVAAIVSATGGVAEATIEATQSIVGNTVIQEGGALAIEFAGSGNSLRGILSINQEAGNMNQQANIRSLVMVDAGGGPGVLHIDINTSQELRGNSLTLRDTGPRSVAITDSFNDGTGIVGINQSAGNLNQQLGVVAVAIGSNVGPEAIHLGDAQLGQIGTPADNELQEEGVQGPRTNTLANSFNGFSGIAQINQTTGDMNRVTQVVGVSITTPAAP